MSMPYLSAFQKVLIELVLCFDVETCQEAHKNNQIV